MKEIAALIGRAVRDADGSAAAEIARRRSRALVGAPPRVPAPLSGSGRGPDVREYLLCLLRRGGGHLPGHQPSCAVARRCGSASIAEVRDRDVHAIPTPRLGGVAMFAGLLRRAACSPTSCRCCAASSPTATRPSGRSSPARAVICLLGVVDDRWGLDAAHQAGRPGRSPPASWCCRASSCCGCPWPGAAARRSTSDVGAR